MAGLTGVFGGTFDPPHLGHLILADEARHALGLDSVLWVVTPDPPHKTDRTITPANLRWEMVHAAIGDTTAFMRSSVDMDRPGPHYALDTLEALRAQGFDQLAYIMGSDSLHDLPDWHRPQDFVAACDLIGVMRRPGVDLDLKSLESQLPGLEAKIRIFETPFIGISGHDIRQRVRDDRAFWYLVLPRVGAFIEKHGLYR